MHLASHPTGNNQTAEMMKVQLTWGAFGQRGAVVSSWKGCRAHAHDDQGQSGAVGKQAGRSGQAKQNEMRGGVLIAELTTYTEGLYILWRMRRLHGMYESRMWLCATVGRLGTMESTTVL